MQDFCNQLKGSAAVGSEVWNENKGTRKDPDSSQFLQHQFSISEASTGAVSTPNSIPSSVIFSSNYSGVKGATDNFDNASSLIYNTAHLKDSLSSSSQASVPAEATSHGVGASIVCRGLNPDYDNSQHSNSHCAQFSPIAGQSHFASSPTQRVDSPAMWNVANSCEGTQGSSVNKSLNQIPHQGAKSTHSESRAGNSLQQAPSESFNDCHSTNSDMQTNVQKMDSSSRYNNDTTTSSHSTNSSTGFMSNAGNNVYRNSIGCGNGVHSNNLQLLNIGANNESNSQNSSFGAPYNNSVNSRVKTQPGNCESSFSGWQGLNTSTTSVPVSNGWLIPNSLSSRNAHDPSSKEGVPKNGDENMVVDNEISYSDLIGSTSGTKNGEEKQQISNGGQGNMSWEMPSRLGLLGSGEGPINPGSNVWNNSHGPVTSSGSNTWDNGRQNIGGTAPDSQGESPDMMDGQSGFSRLIGAIGGTEYAEGKQDGSSGNFKPNASRPLPPRLGLLGGGESSLNTTSSGWSNGGSAGSSNSGWVGGGPRSNNGTSDMTGNNGSGMSPPKPHSWAQAAGKGLTQPQPTSSGNTGHVPSNSDARVSASDNSSAAKVQNDAITEIKVKAAVSEGWGQTPVNQDAPWEVPLSPPLPVDPSAMKDAPPVWSPPVNNGTEIWENNLRLSKGAVAPVVSTTPPWGHTPATNIGGHWGDDDSSNNTWSGAPQPSSQNNANWAEPNPNFQNAMWGNPPPPPVAEKHWSGGSNNSQGGASWNESMVGSENGSAVWNPPVAKQRNVGNWSPTSTPKKEMPPSGWELPSPPTNRRPPVINYDDGTSVWGNPQRQGKVSRWKDMPSAKPIMNSGNNIGNPSSMLPMGGGGGGGMQPSGPGMIRLPSGAMMNSKNDVWGKPSTNPNRNPGWQDMSAHDGPNIGTWGDDGMHMGNSMKNMSGNANVGGGAFGGGNGWSEQQNNSMSGGYYNKSKNSNNWAEGQVDTSSWLGPSKQGGKPLTRDLIWASKQFRVLIEKCYKKEDVENALRNNNMNFEDALAELQASASMEASMMEIDGFHGRKVRPANLHDDMSMSDNVLDINFNSGNFHGSGFQSGGNFQGMGNVGAFKSQIKGPNNASPHLNNTIGGQQSNIGSVGNMTPLFQKLLQQQPQSTQNNMQQFASNMQQLSSQSSRVGPNPFPSTAQLRHLVQQIQMAVQAGHLNPTILNQPLAPQTLQFLYQLLQQIKVLHQLQNTPKSTIGGSIQNVQIAQTKQRIMNLQNQINAQQAVFLKQQVPIQPAQLHAQSSSDIYKPNQEMMPSLHNDFRDLSIKDVPLQGHQQSRLNQWKLPLCEKEEQLCAPSNDFSRAPGPLPSKTSSASSSGPNLHLLLSQGDSAWSSLSRSQTESGWPEPTTSLTGLSDNSAGTGNVSVPASMSTSLGMGNNSNANSGSLDAKEPSTTPPSTGPSTSSASHSSYSLTDLVPEFEPGKPWKGTQMKNIEDDPHITPGSIARSPLSVNTIKDADLFWNSKSNSTAASGNDNAGSLVSNTWMFSQPNTSNGSSGLNKTGNSKANWSTNESNSGSDMWGSKPRGPPPGISAQSCEKQGNTSFLLLRNLTPQIDGSTLKTLCMQHGPLVLFHLSLNHGIALVRYSTKEEASKAQSALNNCVLGNTSILADIPNDGEIQQYLVLLCNQNAPTGYFSWSGSQQGSSNNSSGSSATGVRSNNAAPMSTYPFSLPSGNSAAKQQDSTGWNGNNLNMPSQLWSISNPSSFLWSVPQPISDHESSTNSSLNRFLPDDLLGGESM